MMVMRSISFTVILLCILSTELHAVPAAPNASVAKGTVIEYSITSSPGRSHELPGPALYKIVVSVEAVEDVPGEINFLKERVGEEIPFWSKAKLTPGLFSRKIKAVVEYRGDEHGGMFWIKQIEILK
jgi:hypothetical protein